jgi:hypothetical protein
MLTFLQPIVKSALASIINSRFLVRYELEQLWLEEQEEEIFQLHVFCFFGKTPENSNV